MEFIPAVAMAALLYKLVDFLKYLVNGDRNGVTTQLIAWGAGIGVTVLYARSDWAGILNFGGLSLAKMNIWSQILFGLQMSSLASAGHDFKKAHDNQDTATVPTLLDPGPARQRPAPSLKVVPPR